MKRLLLSAVLTLFTAVVMVGCGGSATESPEGSVDSSVAASTQTSAAASGCTASGLDAMSTLSDFQLEMDAAHKDGRLTLDQLTAARDRLFNETQAATEKEDWAAYCQSIETMRSELGL